MLVTPTRHILHSCWDTGRTLSDHSQVTRNGIFSPLFGVLGVVVVEVEGVLGAVLGVVGGGAPGGSSTLAGTAVTVWYIGVPALPFLESPLVFSLPEVAGGAGVVRVFSPGTGPRGVAPPPLGPATPTTPSLAWTVIMRGSLWRRRNNRIFSGESFPLCVAATPLQPLRQPRVRAAFRQHPRPSCEEKKEKVTLRVSRQRGFVKEINYHNLKRHQFSTSTPPKEAEKGLHTRQQTVK